jgi:hypothetical protein
MPVEGGWWAVIESRVYGRGVWERAATGFGGAHLGPVARS